MKLSVIICTHNPREDYLQRTLDALKDQTFPKEEWELLLIDNACKEPLSEKWDLSWQPHSRHIREEELGLTPARLRGIIESNGEILVFVDDDNILCKSYLKESYDILNSNNMLAVIGAGLISPEYETQPQNELKRYCYRLALRETLQAEWSNVPEKTSRPWGAGLVVRKEVATKYYEEVSQCIFRKSLDRTGDNLLSGGDDEFSFLACAMGYGIGVFPQLQVLHLIPKRRTDLEYLIAITEGHAFSLTILYKTHGLPAPSYQVESTVKDVVYSAARLKISTTIYHLNNWWFSRHSSVYEKRFRSAWSKGVLKAINYKKINS